MARSAGFKRAYTKSEYTPETIQELIRCADDPIYFITKYVKVAHPIKGMVPFALFDYQVEMVKQIHEHKDVIILASRQLGKTTVVAMYILWLSLFFDNKKCIIASKAMMHAVEIMSRIKFAYEELPGWLKAGCKFYSRTQIEFDNGSKIKCEATTEKTGRGESPSILFIDELAFINRRVQEELWASITPALSTGGKFILTSTPNGDDDLFATLWRGANAGTNSFFPIKIMWYQHPERDQAYYDEMRGKLGPLKIRQELDCEFLSSDSLLINPLRLSTIRPTPPVAEQLGISFWTNTIGGKGKTYLVGIDLATGTGGDHTAFEVVEFPALTQVAELRLNTVSIPLIYAKLKWLLKHLRQPGPDGRRAEVIWSFERNGVGEALVAMIQHDDDPKGGVYLDGVELHNDHPTKLGLNTTGKAKLIACMQLKGLVEKLTGGLTIFSDKLLFELKNYIASGGSYAARQGATDDLVAAMLIVVRLLNQLSEYDDRAKQLIYENVSPDAQDDWGDEPVPFFISLPPPHQFFRF